MLIQFVEIELYFTTILAPEQGPKTPAGLGTVSSGITASKWPLTNIFALTSDRMQHLSVERVMWYSIERRGIQRRTFSDRPKKIKWLETV